jgi:hypothetical protein
LEREQAQQVRASSPPPQAHAIRFELNLNYLGANNQPLPPIAADPNARLLFHTSTYDCLASLNGFSRRMVDALAGTLGDPGDAFWQGGVSRPAVRRCGFNVTRATRSSATRRGTSL